MGSKDRPGEFDCYANAQQDEPMFILLARDASAPLIVEAWATERERLIGLGVKPESDMAMVGEARECAEKMREWRVANRGGPNPRLPVEPAPAPAEKREWRDDCPEWSDPKY
jgi:hypothetical protein